MELTKYEHASFTVEKDGKVIIVDPGAFTTDLSVPENVVAVIITHDHGDHFDKDMIDEIMTKNPDALIIGTQEVTSQLGKYETRTVHGGDSFAHEGFDLDFYGDEHAQIHPKVPTGQNVGVLIEDRVYFPGDSFTVPEKSVDILALPVAGPWHSTEEAVEFMKTIGARLTFPTHDALLSATGKRVADDFAKRFAESAGTEYRRIDGETITVE